VPFGSGLNSLSNFNWVDDQRIKWDVCSDASENDCLTPKGFTFMRLQLAPGVYVDSVNLHADAGDLDADNAARSANLEQVMYFLGNNSVSNAVMVFGDTNSRYTRAPDVGLRALVSQQGLSDAWVQRARGGVVPIAGADAILCADPIPTNNSCEVVDKMLCVCSHPTVCTQLTARPPACRYRGSKALTLTATDFVYDTTRFLSSNGSTLTDHNPIRVDFSWTSATAFRTSDLYGGPHGCVHICEHVLNHSDFSLPQKLVQRPCQRSGFTEAQDDHPPRCQPPGRNLLYAHVRRVVRARRHWGLARFTHACHWRDAHQRNCMLGPVQQLDAAVLCAGHYQ
jgi:hypothetical protein